METSNQLGLQVAKLVSGEIVVGSIIKKSILTNVFKLVISFDQTTGIANINMLPYMHPVSSDVGIVIHMDKIITMTDPSEQIATLYIQRITEQIQKNNEEASESKEESKSEESSETKPKKKGKSNVDQSSEN